MRQKSIYFITFIILSFSASTFAANDCKTNSTLKNQNFIIHPTAKFSEYAKMVMDLVKGNENYKAGADFGWYNVELKRYVRLQAFDDVNTVGDIMIDDVVFFSDDITNQLYEVRWFDGVNKNVVYENIKCANGPVPWAYNSMW